MLLSPLDSPWHCRRVLATARTTGTAVTLCSSLVDVVPWPLPLSVDLLCGPEVVAHLSPPICMIATWAGEGMMGILLKKLTCFRDLTVAGANRV